MIINSCRITHQSGPSSLVITQSVQGQPSCRIRNGIRNHRQHSETRQPQTIMPPADIWTIQGKEMAERAGNGNKTDKSSRNTCEEHRQAAWELQEHLEHSSHHDARRHTSRLIFHTAHGHLTWGETEMRWQWHDWRCKHVWVCKLLSF